MRQVSPAQIGPPASVNRYLLPDERSVIAVRMHPAALAGPLVLACGGLATGAGARIVSVPAPQRHRGRRGRGVPGPAGAARRGPARESPTGPGDPPHPAAPAHPETAARCRTRLAA